MLPIVIVRTHAARGIEHITMKVKQSRGVWSGLWPSGRGSTVIDTIAPERNAKKARKLRERSRQL